MIFYPALNASLPLLFKKSLLYASSPLLFKVTSPISAGYFSYSGTQAVLLSVRFCCPTQSVT
jgi:hypothetical protein